MIKQGSKQTSKQIFNKWFKNDKIFGDNNYYHIIVLENGECYVNGSILEGIND